MSLNPSDELSETYLSDADLAKLSAEYSLAVTECLELNPVRHTPAHGMVLPFPRPPADWDSIVNPPRRHMRSPRYVPTWRLVGVSVLVSSLLGALAVIL